MIGFQLVKFCLILVYVVQFSSQEPKITKCVNTPDTWKKVDKVIKECQEDVKLKIFTDVLKWNNDEWDDSFFDHDDQFAWNGHEQHSTIVDHHPQTHDEHPSFIDHYPPVHDLHQHNPHSDHPPQSHDHQSPAHDHHSSSHYHIPSSTHDHVPSLHVHNPSIHSHHSPIYDHHSDKNEHYPSLHTIHRRHPLPTHTTHSPIAPGFSQDHSAKHDTHQIEAPQLKLRQLLTQSTQKKVHLPREHLEHVDNMSSLSDNPVEHNQHIDFNDFRKKRHANDHEWVHPSTVTYHDKRIAGCIMQCIYEKNHAVDKLGWPTLDGLVNFYSEGVNEHGYFMATLRAVDHCLKGSSAKYHVNRRSTPENGQTCDVAFDVFDCISDQITEYCSDHQHHTS